ncbi:hypothetical protein [Frankia tisae]|uniref:hypothetical protein n=1 Tax=Frankia tisae TaxID=2950104 RepID=UPI0021C23F69|nr:hypothetical protein [Frankia tisae]
MSVDPTRLLVLGAARQEQPATGYAIMREQGATAALLIPQGLGLLHATFSPSDQGKAFSIFGPVVGLAAVVGPVPAASLPRPARLVSSRSRGWHPPRASTPSGSSSSASQRHSSPVGTSLDRCCCGASVWDS